MCRLSYLCKVRNPPKGTLILRGICAACSPHRIKMDQNVASKKTAKELEQVGQFLKIWEYWFFGYLFLEAEVGS